LGKAPLPHTGLSVFWGGELFSDTFSTFRTSLSIRAEIRYSTVFPCRF